MTNSRRWYLYIVNAISLQAVAWAAISLLRNLLVRGLGAGQTAVSFDAEAVALQIAIIVIGLPIYIGHWLWAGRLAAQAPAERGSILRRLYLLGMMAIFLGAAAASSFSLLDALLRLLLNIDPIPFESPNLALGQTAVYYALSLIVLALLWLYHRRLLAADQQHIPTPEVGSATLHRLYLYGFTAAGLALFTGGLVSIITWLLFQFGGETAVFSPPIAQFPTELARLLIGLPLWLIFWRSAQQQFLQKKAEQESIIRKAYLYLAIFVGLVMVAVQATGILAALFRSLLDVEVEGNLRRSLATVAGGVLLWGYHAVVLQRETAVLAEQPRQATIRRIYLYLVAAVGLAAGLFGLSGSVSVLLRTLSGEAFIGDPRRQLAGYAAALLVGLPIWFLPWRKIEQTLAAGLAERLSQVRKAYLYFYLLIATLTVLTSAVFVVSQLISLALGARTASGLFLEIAHAIAFTVIAAAVWLYHARLLREDGRFEAAAAAEALAKWRVGVVDGENGRLGRALLDQLQHDLPQLTLQPIGLTHTAAEAMAAPTDQPPNALLTNLDLIIGSWHIALPNGSDGQAVAYALQQSPAHKLLLPTRPDGWDWVGVDDFDQDALLRQTSHAVQQLVRGQTKPASRRLNLVALIIAVIAGLIAFSIAMSAVVNIFF